MLDDTSMPCPTSSLQSTAVCLLPTSLSEFIQTCKCIRRTDKVYFSLFFLTVAMPLQDNTLDLVGDKRDWVVGIMLFATVVKLGLTLYCQSFSNEIVKAYALDHFFDVVTNVIGLIAALLASIFYWWIDPAGAIVVRSLRFQTPTCFCVAMHRMILPLPYPTPKPQSGLCVRRKVQKCRVITVTRLLTNFCDVRTMQLALYTIRTWSMTVLENVNSLVSKTATPDFLQKLTYLCWNHHKEIRQIDTVRAYTFGSHYFAEVDIVLPGDMPLQQAHDIGESLQNKLESLPEIERAFVHLDYEVSHRPEHAGHEYK